MPVLLLRGRVIVIVAFCVCAIVSVRQYVFARMEESSRRLGSTYLRDPDHRHVVSAGVQEWFGAPSAPALLLEGCSGATAYCTGSRSYHRGCRCRNRRGRGRVWNACEVYRCHRRGHGCKVRKVLGRSVTRTKTRRQEMGYSQATRGWRRSTSTFGNGDGWRPAHRGWGMAHEKNIGAKW